MFRIFVNTTRNVLELDLKAGTRASDVIQQVLSQSSGSSESELTEQGARDEGKCYLRVRRTLEEGRWWSEDGIKAYRDRMYPL
jgi:hypothetical protein